MNLKRNPLLIVLGISISITMLMSCEKKTPITTKKHSTFQPKTYCNPLDIDYTYSVIGTSRGLSYRSAADPAVVRHNNEFYMFATRSNGYWHSKNMHSWEFIHPENWYFEACNAPAAWSIDSTLLALGNPTPYMSLISADDPYKGNWKGQSAIIPLPIRDPALFVDDNGKTYLYEGSSNLYPLVGIELDPKNHYLPIGEKKDFILLDPDAHGWERFGENHVSPRKPYTEGAWVTKNNGKYYLEYAAPGTQWNVYADGVYVGDHPLGPFKYAPYNPVSYKPGGFVTGAGHGSTVQDNQGNYWHYATMRISVNYIMERRIDMFPAGFESDGQMYVNTAYGDYPHFLPEEEVKEHKNRFTGWMLLSYKKPITASSVKEIGKMNRLDESKDGWMLPVENITHNAVNANDENIQTFWVAKTNSDKEWLEIDLQNKSTVYAAQINYHDYNSDISGKPDTLRHQFTIEYSMNKIDWNIAVDYSENKRDQPNAYIEFEPPVTARYVRFKNKHVPTRNLAVSGFRIFGKGTGNAPDAPTNFSVVRESDPRNAHITWNPVKNAVGYTLYWGIAKDKLNNSVMIYDDAFYDLRALNVGQDYYYAIETFNENGISERLHLE